MTVKKTDAAAAKKTSSDLSIKLRRTGWQADPMTGVNAIKQYPNTFVKSSSFFGESECEKFMQPAQCFR
jgi:hypothetical protein